LVHTRTNKLKYGRR